MIWISFGHSWLLILDDQSLGLIYWSQYILHTSGRVSDNTDVWSYLVFMLWLLWFPGKYGCSQNYRCVIHSAVEDIRYIYNVFISYYFECLCIGPIKIIRSRGLLKKGHYCVGIQTYSEFYSSVNQNGKNVYHFLAGELEEIYLIPLKYIPTITTCYQEYVQLILSYSWYIFYALQAFFIIELE